MMKAYYYLLFRIYKFYTDRMKEKDITLGYVTSVSTVLIFLNLFTIYTVLDYFDLIPMFENKYYTLLFIGIIWMLNYFLFVKSKEFLNYNFKKDFRGGILIIVYIIATAVAFIIISNYNRAKIFGSVPEMLF